jgi:signal peptidase
MKKKNILDNKRFNTIINIVSTVILIVSIVICVNVVLSAKADIGVPNFGSYSFLSVKSNSMNPTFYKGDLIVIKRYANDGRHEYKVDDVISFVAKNNTGEYYVNTHRVHDIIEGADYRAYVTKGDHPKAPVDENHVPASNVLGVYTGVRVSKLGSVLDFTKTPKGVVLMIVLPAALIVIWQLFNYLRSLALGRQEVASATGTPSQVPWQYYPPAAESEKEAIIQEYLRKQQEEEFKKQQIIEEYLAKQKELEEAEKAKAEEEKIKAIIAEFLAQQKAAEQGEKTDSPDDETNS